VRNRNRPRRCALCLPPSLVLLLHEVSWYLLLHCAIARPGARSSPGHECAAHSSLVIITHWPRYTCNLPCSQPTPGPMWPRHGHVLSLLLASQRAQPATRKGDSTVIALLAPSGRALQSRCRRLVPVCACACATAAWTWTCTVTISLSSNGALTKT